MTDYDAIAAALRGRLAELTGEVTSLEAARQAPLDADFAEQATELESADALAGIEDSHRTEISAIHMALAQIDAGAYGVCSVCGTPIPAARLKVMPAATTCIAHARS
ncbi:MAG: TraR/DksA C4-type zinc finger protein [Sandarakinorhabdus sp.]|nr:TraR/DksA C4-type zinc finger protein [Sandarakinorhabdus sp.]